MSTSVASTWGHPNATNRVLLLHGGTNTSQMWYRIAEQFATRGCFVTAPDLLGHGLARRSDDYSIAALANELRPLLAADHYHIVVGASLGGVVAAALLPFFTHPVHVVLVDPPLEQSPEVHDLRKTLILQMVRNPLTPEGFHKLLPTQTFEDAIFRSVSTRLCDAATVEALFDQNVPWSFSHLLSAAPANVKLTALVADPAKRPCLTEEELKPYPHVIVKTVWGASHHMPTERPEVIVETALEV